MASHAPIRWTPAADDVQRSVMKLVLTLVELLRQLLERQTLRRMDQGTLSSEEILDLGPLGRLI